MSIVCEYCQASNSEKEKNCVACGAPLKKKIVIATHNKVKIDEPEKNPDKSVETARKVANIYSSFWLAFFDAVIIAAVSFTIGLAGGIVDQPALGVLGACLLGFAVSITIKNGIATLISAPIGVLAGSILCVIAMIIHLPTFFYPILLTVSSCIIAVFGGTSVPYRLRTTWLKIRPYLGTLGGFLFGLLGMGIGLGLEVVYTNLLQFLQELG